MCMGVEASLCVCVCVCVWHHVLSSIRTFSRNRNELWICGISFDGHHAWECNSNRVCGRSGCNCVSVCGCGRGRGRGSGCPDSLVYLTLCVCVCQCIRLNAASTWNSQPKCQVAIIIIVLALQYQSRWHRCHPCLRRSRCRCRCWYRRRLMTQMTRIATATADVIFMRRDAARSKLNGKFAKAIDENSLTRATTYVCVGVTPKCVGVCVRERECGLYAYGKFFSYKKHLSGTQKQCKFLTNIIIRLIKYLIKSIKN